MLTSLFSCQSESLSNEDVVGVWKHNNAVLKFDSSGIFQGKSLPVNLFFVNSSLLGTKMIQSTFDGSGMWKIEKASDGFDVRIEFNHTTIPTIPKYEMSLHLNKGRMLESADPMKIFLWEGEEGDKRYEFLKR